MRSSRLELAWYWLLLAGLVAVSGAAAHQARDFSGSWLVVAGLGLLIWFGLSREVRLSTDEIHAVYKVGDPKPPAPGEAPAAAVKTAGKEPAAKRPAAKKPSTRASKGAAK